MHASGRARTRLGVAAALVVGGGLVGPVGQPPVHGGPAPVASAAEVDYTWAPVRIGGGGNVTGIDGADDGTVVARVDVYGGYVLEPGARTWRQLVTTAAMPQDWRLPTLGKGIQEIAIAPSDSDRIYLMFAGHLFVTYDGGVSFEETTYPSTNWDSNGDFGRGFGDRMAVDPANPDVVLAGAPNTPLRVSFDGGGSWADTTVPQGVRHAHLADASGDQILSVGITGIAFDRSAAVVDTRTSVAYAASWGHGVYQTTDGGDTWTAIGGPTEVQHAAVDAAGRYFTTNGDKHGPYSVMMYDGEWHDISPPDWDPGEVGGIASVENPFIAASPHEPGLAVVGYAKQMFRTTDAGLTWTALEWSDGPGDVTWADSTARNYYLVASDLFFDREDPTRLWLTTGSGVQFAEFDPAEPAIVWQEKTRGIESMVATDVVSTKGGTPVFSIFDFGQFGGSKRLDDFSLKKGPVPFFSGTTSLDASPFTTGFAVSTTTDYVQYGRFPISSAYTTDGGRTWTRFRTMPKQATSAAQFGYGAIAVSSSNNIVWAPGRYYPTETDDFQPYYTRDRGRTWNPVVLPGVTDYPADSIGGFMFGRNRQTVVADQVRKGVFYIYMDDEGVFRTTNEGRTWTRVHDGNFAAGQPGSSGLMAAVPRQAGTLYYTDGSVGGHDWQGAQQYGGYPFYRSIDGGATWNTVPGVSKVMTFGFGAPIKPSRQTTIYLVGTVGTEYGIWRSTDNAVSWTKIGDHPYTLDWVTTISGDDVKPGLVYLGFAGSSFVYGKPTAGEPARRATGR